MTQSLLCINLVSRYDALQSYGYVLNLLVVWYMLSVFITLVMMEPMFDGYMHVGCEEIVENTIIKRRVKQSSEGKRQCNSKILKRLLRCLSENKHAHMLKISNVKKNEFDVTFTNKKSRGWGEEDISLFKEMDDLFSKPRKKASYAEDCKVRFKANMQKLCSSGFLQRVALRKESTSVKIITYRILRYPDDVKSTKAKSKRNGKKQMNMESQISDSIETSAYKGPNIVSLPPVPGVNQFVPDHGLEGKPNTVPSIFLIYIDDVTNVQASKNPGVRLYNEVFLEKSVQEENVNYITYDSVEANGNPDVRLYNENFLEKPVQEENVNSTMYNSVEANECPGVRLYNENFSEKSVQEENVNSTTYDTVEANKIPGVRLYNENFLEKSVQEENVNSTTYDSVEGSENLGVRLYNETFLEKSVQEENVNSTTYDTLNKEIELFDSKEKMIRHENPVLSSAWKTRDMIKDGSNFPHSEDDWMEDFKLLDKI